MANDGTLRLATKALWRHLLQHAAAPPTVPMLSDEGIVREIGCNEAEYAEAYSELALCRALLSPSHRELAKLAAFEKTRGAFVLWTRADGRREYLKVLSPSEIQQAAVAEVEILRREREQTTPLQGPVAMYWQNWVKREPGIDYRANIPTLGPEAMSKVATTSLSELVDLRTILNPPFDRPTFGAIVLARFDLEKTARLDWIDARTLYLQRLIESIETFEREHAVHRRDPIPERVRREVWQRDGGRCVQCGSQLDLEFDHLIPHSKGGSSTARNLRLLCERCNRSKGARI